MLGAGDWRKLEDQINAVLVPMGERIDALEAKVKELEAPKPPKSTPKPTPKASS
tara:strand:- start:2534 stop:2695 length:162 start_codon:yes stop_codon:yes gene_type:complete